MARGGDLLRGVDICGLDIAGWLISDRSSAILMDIIRDHLLYPMAKSPLIALALGAVTSPYCIKQLAKALENGRLQYFQIHPCSNLADISPLLTRNVTDYNQLISVCFDRHSNSDPTLKDEMLSITMGDYLGNTRSLIELKDAIKKAAGRNPDSDIKGLNFVNVIKSTLENRQENQKKAAMLLSKKISRLEAGLDASTMKYYDKANMRNTIFAMAFDSPVVTENEQLKKASTCVML